MVFNNHQEHRHQHLDNYAHERCKVVHGLWIDHNENKSRKHNHISLQMQYQHLYLNEHYNPNYKYQYILVHTLYTFQMMAFDHALIHTSMNI
eukprot:UN00014